MTPQRCVAHSRKMSHRGCHQVSPAVQLIHLAVSYSFTHLVVFSENETPFCCCCLQESALPLRTSHCSVLQPNTAGFSVTALAFSSSEVPEGGWRLTALSDQPLKGWSEQMSSRIESFDGEHFLPHTADLLTSQALHCTSNHVHQTHRMSPNATL